MESYLWVIKLKPHIINKKRHFIGGWYIDKNVCTDLIKYFENSPNKKQGVLGFDRKFTVNKKAKLSTDVSISPKNQDQEILNYLHLFEFRQTVERKI